MLQHNKSLILATIMSSLFISQQALAARQIINGVDVAGVTVDGTAEGVDFQTDNKLTVNDAENIGDTAGVSTITTAGSTGTIQFDGSSTVSGDINGPLKQITINGAGNTVNMNGHVNADTTNFAVDGTLAIADTKNVTGNITNTTTNEGTLTLNGAHTITGNIGSTGSGLKLVTVGTGGNTVVTTGNILAATTNFAADGELQVADTKSITGNVTTSTNNTGTLTFLGGGTMTGNIGTSGGNVLKVVQLTGVNTLNTTGDINTTDFNFLGDGVLNVAAGKNINGQVSGPGGGGGTINYAGNSTTGGVLGNANALTAVNINAGTLSLGHNISATDATVAVGATMTPSVNNLTISNNLNVNGSLNLGSNTLNVGGAYNQNANSTLNVTVTGGGAPTSGNIVDTGNAGVDATSTVNISVTGGGIQDNTKIQILSSAAGVGVNVPNITGNTQTYTFSLVTENGAAPGKDLFIVVDRRSFPEANNMTTGQLAALLESVAVNPALAPQLGPLIGALNALPTNKAISDSLTTLVPLADGSLMAVSQTATTKGLHPITNRLDHLRADLGNYQVGYSAGDAIQGGGLWVQFYGHDINQDMREAIAGYDAVNAGVALGGDIRLNDNANIGLGFNYSHTNVDSNGVGKSEFNVDSFQGILYGSLMFDEPFYIDALLSMTYHDYDSKRNIIVPPGVGGLTGIRAAAFADFQAWQYTAQGDFGYQWIKDNFIVNPFIRLRYSHLSFDDYTETGAGPLNLRVAYDDMNEFILGGGLKLGMIFQAQQVKVLPAIHLGIYHDFENDKQVSTSNFIGGGSSFAAPGPKPDDTSYQAGASVDFLCQNNLTFTLYYDYEFKDDFDVHSAFAKLRWDW